MNHTVLIVDEDVNARIIAATLLESRGLCAHAAADGTEAYEILRQRGTSIAVLVVDLDEAACGMNGWELLRCLRGRFGGLPLPARPRVLAVSRHAAVETERFARTLGADAFLHKPLPPRQFIQTVESLLGAPQSAQSGSASKWLTVASA